MNLSQLESFLRAVDTDENLRDVQEPVRQQLDEVRGALRGFFDSSMPIVEKIGDYIVGVPGKLFRPTLVLLVSGQKGGATPDVIFSATIVELIHTATLIHDDTIDRSQLRRGKPTLNAIYDDMAATIVGDFVYTKAFVSLLERDLRQVLEVVARTAYRMSLGEMLQIQHRGALEISEEGYLELIDCKTASLMSAACEIGALSTPGGRDEHERFRDFGRYLGLAYQITDDLFDFVGDSDQLGKVLQSDLEEGKVTLPLIHALTQATGPEKREIKRMLQAPSLQSADWEKVLTILHRYSGLEYGRRRALEMADCARSALAGLKATPYLKALEQAVEYAVVRTH
ncbi:MAG: octaprenyl diphosphate synthase [Candidatus Eisenbacteria bacterium]|nr:octaprenyl diphosphate synthase [Candidatus Eisenbacteria bacterium]